MDGLGQDFELVALGPGAVEQVGGGGLPGEEQDLAGGQYPADADGGVDAVEVGHHDVADEHVGPEGRRKLNGLLAAIDGGGIETGLIEDNREGVGDHALIVGDEHFGLDLYVGHSYLFFFFILQLVLAMLSIFRQRKIDDSGESRKLIASIRNLLV
jgi:hypothetical protein